MWCVGWFVGWVVGTFKGNEPLNQFWILMRKNFPVRRWLSFLRGARWRLFSINSPKFLRASTGLGGVDISAIEETHYKQHREMVQPPHWRQYNGNRLSFNWYFFLLDFGWPGLKCFCTAFFPLKMAHKICLTQIDVVANFFRWGNQSPDFLAANFLNCG